MSSTQRGGKRSEADSYPTPPWVTHRFLEVCPLPGGVWLEPGAGEGAIIRAVNQVRSDVGWKAIDIREETKGVLDPLVGDPAQVHIGDFTAPGAVFQYDLHAEVAIGNPPFSLAMEFIQASLEAATHVAMLLRLNYLGSEKRHAFFTTYAPDIYVVPNRPSFRGTGHDSIEYAWFVWNEPAKRRRSEGKYKVLDLTPLEERGGKKKPM